MTFNVYGPADATCGAAPVCTSTNALNAAGTTATSTPFTVTAPGTYRFVAVYSGDANYPSATSACNAANESAEGRHPAVPHTGQPVHTLTRTFAVCAPPVVPRFTG